MEGSRPRELLRNARRACSARCNGSRGREPSAQGAYSAINKAGKIDQIKIISFDASPAGKQAVFEKKFYDTPQQFPRKMAAGTVEAFIKHLDGKEVPKTIFIPCAHYYYEDSVKDESRVSEQW